MTINKTYDLVTFWEVSDHKQYELRGRVLEGNENKL